MFRKLLYKSLILVPVPLSSKVIGGCSKMCLKRHKSSMVNGMLNLLRHDQLSCYFIHAGGVTPPSCSHKNIPDFVAFVFAIIEMSCSNLLRVNGLLPAGSF